MEALLGGLLGGAARLAPEFLSFFDRKNRRKHELAMGQQQMDLLTAQSHTRIEEVNAESEGAQAAAAMEALRDSIKAQAKPTGIKWVDALSATVRPVWTYLVLLAWASVKYVNVAMLIAQGAEWSDVQTLLWTVDDASMLSTLATFWFLDRVLRKNPR